MNKLLEKYLYVDSEAYYTSYDGRVFAQSVHGRSYLRYNKAKEQVKKNAVSVEKIMEIIKDFLQEIGITTSENPVIKNPMTINYQEIKERYGLESQSDIVWIKFTCDGYVGVVATSDDINFDFPSK